MATPKLTPCKALLLGMLLLLPVAAGCRLEPFEATDISGGMLVRHGSYIYRIGGRNADGTASTDILMAKINLGAAGEAGALLWQQTAPLPGGRAYAAAFAAGNLLYVLGGEGDNETITADIAYTRINPDDGTLGFGETKFWEHNSTALPEALSHAACELYDGRVFLIGGTTGQGPTDAIMHARLYQDGKIGKWYTSPRKLPSARSGAASAIHNDWLAVAGGADASGAVLDDLASYAIGAYGLLEEPETATLPKALYTPVLLSDGASLILAGGYDAQLKGSRASYRYSDGSWAREKFAIRAEGPTSGRAAGGLWYVEQARRRSLPRITQASGMKLAPDRPIIVPGSGLVPTGSPVRAHAEPGTTLYFHAGTEASGDWATLDTLGTLSAPAAYTFGSFSPAYPSEAASPPVKRTYRTRSTGFFVSVSGVLTPQEPAEPLATIHLRDDMSDETSSALSAIWCRLAVDTQDELQLTFADADSPAGSAYTGRVRLTLYETDLYTEALDSSGLPVLEFTSAAAQPVGLVLQPGSYYLHIEDLDGLTGRTLGLAVYGQ